MSHSEQEVYMLGGRGGGVGVVSLLHQCYAVRIYHSEQEVYMLTTMSLKFFYDIMSYCFFFSLP